ncbi:hypothetical protein GCM10011367_17250 [Marinicauda pacifica]|uniref:HNH endonuclease n=1 Tax=Marinicauda pacifica TaxID=1133559 RepID=A0A4S2HBT6_9PROT|nr:HNH endonuclease [Marinicauda pacifica]TGY93131.1 HNH endonuclease [Marinicauda pacifica]GGE43130.1 hypothetical protein GCM10011367_17250 [Marinicauda pacifica]
MTPLDRIRLTKAATDNGFSYPVGERDGGLLFEGMLRARLWLTRSEDGNYIAASDHAGLESELDAPRASAAAPDGFAAFEADSLPALERLVRNIFRLAKTLPDEPIAEYEAKIRELGLLGETETVRAQRVRVGQNIFRRNLLIYWEGQCAVTGASNEKLLKASHTRPWRECETRAQRLDTANGFLLAANLDAAFDAFLISFDEAGRIIFAPSLTRHDKDALGLHDAMRLRWVTDKHEVYLREHRERTLRNSAAS